MTQICYLWSSANVLWKDANWKWSECFTSVEAGVPGVDATTLVQPWIEEPWNPYRAGELEKQKQRIVEVIGTINGTRYVMNKKSKKFPLIIKEVKITPDSQNIYVMIENGKMPSNEL